MEKLDRHTWLGTKEQTKAVELMRIKLGCDKTELTRIALGLLAKSMKMDFPRDEPTWGGNRKQK